MGIQIGVPGKFEVADRVDSDLVQWAVTLLVEGPAVRQPVAGLGIGILDSFDIDPGSASVGCSAGLRLVGICRLLFSACNKNYCDAS